MYKYFRWLLQPVTGIVLVLVGLFFGYAFSVWSAPNTFEVKNDNAANILLVTPSQPSLREKIQLGQELLRDSPRLLFEEKEETTYQLNKQGKRVAVKTHTLVRKQIALAILNQTTGQVLERRYWLSETDIKAADLIRRTYLPYFNLPSFTPEVGSEDFIVSVNWWNSFNSDLRVSKVGESRSDYIVIGLKYLMDNKLLAYPEDRSETLNYADIVYVPYSESLHTPELVRAGQDFLDQKVNSALAQLRQRRLYSRAFPNRLVADTLSEQFIKNIFMTEQTDPKLVLGAADGGKKLAERVLVRLGTNSERAFRYTYSKTGALGIGQIMPATYNSVVARYPTATLIEDTDLGRVDISNSITASILVFDDHIKAVDDRVTKQNSTAATRFWQEIVNNAPHLEEIRAAIYNGGPGKYKVLTGTVSVAVKETVDFVAKFKRIRDLSLF